MVFPPQTLVWHGRTWNRTTLALATTGKYILDNPLWWKLCSHLRAFLWGWRGRAVHHPKSVAVGRVPLAAKVFGKGHKHLKAALRNGYGLTVPHRVLYRSEHSSSGHPSTSFIKHNALQENQGFVFSIPPPASALTSVGRNHRS